MTREISKAYEPKLIEERWGRAWVEERLFTPEVAAKFRAPSKPAFSLAIPPPNVTGSLHMGHMLEHTQIDILLRWRRMLGHRTLWLPGTDHASIAVHVLMERALAKEKLTRQQLGREEFLRRAWKWKAESGDNIKNQMIRTGASVDWSRECFTMDVPRYRAVLEAFLRLYHEKLIYRGRYIISWCPHDQTALSDLEVVHEERDTQLYFIKYPILGTSQHVVVATTRPETMLGDTAVAVHPGDERYQAWIGKKVLLPLMEREIPIVADEFVDREFATGAVKVTPAHDANDFELARRHSLPEVDVMDEAGHINSRGGRYAGLDRFEARKRVLADLKQQGLLEKAEHYRHALGTCQRCKTPVEPRISTQWFCRMKELAAPAIEAVRGGLIRVLPENNVKIYLNWMENIRDWCISRQLWWGHRIPVWHCADCKGLTPARDSLVEAVNGQAQPASPPSKCADCGSSRLEQDPDVLDTWFSSALWPFSTLGWPDDTPDLISFYPTTLMINGFDILFFWDARMIMMGLKLMPREKREERIPFHTLYIHALVRDPEGQKMSKTRGNVTDPLALTEQYGTDALRFTLAVMAAPGTDIILSEERMLSARAFANKIWNAARFLFFNLEKQSSAGFTLDDLAGPEARAGAPYAVSGEHPLVDRWIFSRLSAVTAQINDALEGFRFHEAAHIVYQFFWHEYCDWYIEWVKPALASADRAAAASSWRNVFAVFEAALRLLHPVMPFLTEELWHKLPQRAGARSIALEAFPQPHADWADQEAERQFDYLQRILASVRNFRSVGKLDAKTRISLSFNFPTIDDLNLVQSNLGAVLRLSFVSDASLHHNPALWPGGTGPYHVFEFGLVSGPEINVGAQITRMRKEKERLARDLQAKQSRLSDETFRSRAPAKVVHDMENMLRERKIEYQKLTERLAQLERSHGGGS